MAAAPRRQSKGGSELDVWGRAYANLVRNPCYGRLVPPAYSGSAGGILTRFETDFIVNAQAADTGAFIAFTPGILGTAATTYGTVMGATGTILSDSATIVPQALPTRQPGVGLTASMAAARCVSACIQVSFMGSELQRAGICSVGQLTYQDLNGTFSLATLRSLSETVVKIPDGELELKLRPTAESETFYPVNAVANTNLAAQPTLVATMSGIPGSAGMRVRVVAVYEWLPQNSSGVVASSSNTSQTANTLNQVVHALDRAAPGWAATLLTAATRIPPPIAAFA
jgi:hypothetical protein